MSHPEVDMNHHEVDMSHAVQLRSRVIMSHYGVYMNLSLSSLTIQLLQIGSSTHMSHIHSKGRSDRVRGWGWVKSRDCVRVRAWGRGRDWVRCRGKDWVREWTIMTTIHYND